MTHTADALIVKEVLYGNKEAYVHLVNRYKRPLYNLALRMTSSAEDAQDLSQEAFVKAYANLHKYKSDKSFFTWLYTICLNLTRNHLGKKREILGNSDRNFTESQDIDGASYNCSPEDLIHGQQEIKCLKKALHALPVDLREALVLRYMQELPLDQVAQVLDVSLSAAKMRVYRGLEKIRTLMASMEKDYEF